MEQIIQTFKDLRIWQDSRKLVKAVYELTDQLPQDEKYGLSSQLRRCAVSIPSNIAEGHSRGTTKDYLHFLVMARGSLAELDTQLILCCDLGYMDERKVTPLAKEINTIERMINRLRSKLKAKL